ncbi:MAG: hypothetical protein KBC32_11080 [Candidatus Didemnitutus sp.]|nr:hypothetical protein [Candidatus Didemnitutus sp.]
MKRHAAGGDLGPVEPGSFRSPSLRSQMMLFGALFLWILPGPLAAQSNYEGAISAKLSEIEWTRADLQAAQRELAILDEFLGGYETNSGQLDAARQQLASADGKLATIQQQNLVKLTIRMGIETYNTVADSINLGKSAASALVTNGVSSAIGSVAFDQFTNGLTNESRAALGMDAAHLTTPRTVKIQAVSAAARDAFPELARVQQTLSLSLEAVKAAAYHEDGTELGDTGAILRKNLMVRDEIAAALGKLAVLDTEADTAKEEAESRRPEVQADVDRLTNELNELQSQLDTLRTQQAEAEAVERAAANAAATIPPADLPIPVVNVPREDQEDDLSYAARVQAAIRAAAQARWDAEAPPLLAAIAERKTLIDEMQATLLAGVKTTVTDPDLAYFIGSHSASASTDFGTTASYASTLGSHDALQTWIVAVTAAAPGLSGLITQAEALSDEYTELHNDQNKIVALVDLLVESGVFPLPFNYGSALSDSGMGQPAAEAHAATYAQLQSEFPAALENAQERLAQLAAAGEAWSSGIHAVRTDLDAQLVAAEGALAELIARGQAWDSALASATGLVVDHTNTLYQSRAGYYTDTTFTPVIRHSFSFPTYQQELLAALSQRGSAGLTAAQGLKQKYDTLVALSSSLKDSYDAAILRYHAAYARVSAYSSGYSTNFPVLEDLRGAASYSSEAHPVDASGVTDQAERYRSLFNTNTYTHMTSLSGGPPISGQPALQWIGLPRLRQLPDPGLDDPAAYLPHRILAVKSTVLQDGPDWIGLPPAQFNAHYSDSMNELFAVIDAANTTGESDVQSVVFAVFGDLSDLHDAYTAAHPPAVITTQPASSNNSIPAGTTFSTTLSVAATGDFLSYEWFTTQWPDYEYTWTKIEGATASTYTTPELTSTTHYRVRITNPGGEVISEKATVGIYQVYPPPVFTSPAKATARVGVPFSWTFTTEPAGWVSSHGVALPSGLNFNFMTGQLEGTPLVAGTYVLNIMASNQGTMAFQSFELTIEPGTLTGYDSWLVQWTTPEERLNSYFMHALSTPAGDGVPNLLKYAFNLLGTGPGQSASLATPNLGVLAAAGAAGLPAIGVSGDGRVTLLYVRRKAASQPGITYVVEFSSTLEPDSWTTNASATETVTSLDDTWERVLVTDSLAATPRRFVRVRVERP